MKLGRQKYDRAKAARGDVIFHDNARGNCFDCHTDEGTGSDSVGSTNLTRPDLYLYGRRRAAALRPNPRRIHTDAVNPGARRDKLGRERDELFAQRTAWRSRLSSAASNGRLPAQPSPAQPSPAQPSTVRRRADRVLVHGAKLSQPAATGVARRTAGEAERHHTTTCWFGLKTNVIHNISVLQRLTAGIRLRIHVVSIRDGKPGFF